MKSWIAAATALSMGLSASSVLAQEAVMMDKPFKTFMSADADSTKSINYSQVQTFLDRVVVEDRGRTQIFYTAVKDHGLPFVNEVIASLSGQDVTTLNSNEQLAYWLNVHNLVMMKAVATETNLRNLNEDRLAGNQDDFWRKKRINVAGVDLSLEDIQVEILGANFGDKPNVAYGLYQGIEGGPTLPAKLFTGAKVEKQLEKLGSEYVNSKSALRLRGEKSTLSPVYGWLKQPFFGDDDQKILAHISEKLSDKKSAKFSKVQNIKYHKLNTKIEAYQPRALSQPSSKPRPSSGGYGS